MTSEYEDRVEAFRRRFQEDVSSGALRTREEYLREYPELEAEIEAALDGPMSTGKLDTSARDEMTERVPRTDAAAMTVVSAEDSESRLTAGRIGSYRFVEELGRGGQGVVYLAHDEKLDRMVAIKLLAYSQGLLPGARMRFEREAKAVARLDEPGIARVYESGEEEGVLYIVMEYVRGKTLAAHVREAKREGRAVSASVHIEFEAITEGSRPESDEAATKKSGRVSERDASRSSVSTDREAVLGLVRLVESAARAVHVANEENLVHRDLKPANIMVRENGDACVLDFGMARDLQAVDAALTGASAVGTPPYMAPEQIEGRNELIDRRTDVWALGVTLYEACTLQRPFRGKDLHELRRAITELEPLAPRSLNPHLSRDLEAIILTALDKNLERRYATAEALAEDLRRFREREPVVARPAPFWLKTQRWAQRHPATAGLIAVIFLALTGTTIWTGYKNRELDRSNTRLLDTNRNLVEKTKQERIQRHRTLLREAELQMSQGRYREALDTWAKADALGLTPPAEYALQRTRGRLGLLDYEGARDEILDLDPSGLPAELGARVLLMRGNFASSKTAGRGHADIEAALATGALSEAEAAYARARLAESAPEALALAERTLELDPEHVLARELRGMLFFLMADDRGLEGHAELHRLGFAGDPRAQIFELMALELRAEALSEERRTQLRSELAAHLNEQVHEEIEDLVAVVTSLREAERLLVLATFGDRREATRRARASMIAAQKKAAARRLEERGWGVLGIGSLAMTKDLTRVSDLLLPAARSEKATGRMLEELRAIHERLPNPFFAMVEGATAIGKRRVDEAMDAARRLLKGRLNVDRATMGHGILAIGTYMKFMTERPEDPVELRALKEEWRRHATWLLEYEGLSAEFHDVLAEAGAAIGEELIARRFSDALQRRFPDDWRGPLRDAGVRHEFGDLDRAIAILEELIEREPADSSDRRVQAEARKFLSEWRVEDDD